MTEASWRTAGPGDVAASSIKLELTTITKSMVEENAMSFHAEDPKFSLREALGEHINAEDQRSLERIGVRSIGQLNELRQAAGADVVARLARMPVNRLQQAMLAASAPRVTRVETEPAVPRGIEPGIGRLGDVDTAVTLLRFESGALGAIDNSRKAAYGYDQRCEVFGSAGCALAPNVAPTAVESWSAEGRKQAPPHHFFIERYQEAYLAELREFARAIREDRAPAVGGEDGLKAVLIALAAKQSLQERRPVRVAEAACPTLH